MSKLLVLNILQTIMYLVGAILVCLANDMPPALIAIAGGVCGGSFIRIFWELDRCR